MKAEDLKVGHVLVDPDGHIYEVVALKEIGRAYIVAWLWPDASPFPNYFQTFKREDDIVAISQAERGDTNDAE